MVAYQRRDLPLAAALLSAPGFGALPPDEDGHTERRDRVGPPPAEHGVQAYPREREDGKPEARGRLKRIRLERAAPEAPRDATLGAGEPTQLVLDPAGFLVVYPDRARGLVLEHYRKDGVLDLVIQGATATAVAATAIERGVLSRLDHAAYLGRELARAEESLRTSAPYVQDRAPEPPPRDEPHESCGCSTPN